MDQKKQMPPHNENISSGSNAFEDLTSHETTAAPSAGEEADHFYESQIDRTEFVQNFKVSIDEREPVNSRSNPLSNLHKSVKARQQAAKAGEEETAVKKKEEKNNHLQPQSAGVVRGFGHLDCELALSALLYQRRARFNGERHQNKRHDPGKRFPKRDPANLAGE